LDEFFQSLVDQNLIGRNEEGGMSLTSGGERKIRKSAFEEIFGSLERSNAGYHPIRTSGEGIERLPETKSWDFGDDLNLIDSTRSLQNALKRTKGELDLAEEDLEVFETEHLTSCATIVAIDISHSMILYGDRAQQVALSDLPYLAAGPYHTNTREALQLARGLLARQKQPNKQIFLITDGKPSAITEGDRVYKNPFGLDLRIVNLTLEEADVCRRQKVVITTF